MDTAAYVSGLRVSTPDFSISSGNQLRSVLRGTGAAPGSDAAPAVVNMGALLSFVGDLDEQDRLDVLQSVQLAQRAADAQHDRFVDTESWYQIFSDVLKRVGWVTQHVAEVTQDQKSGKASIDGSAIQLLSAFASQNALNILSSALETLKSMSEKSGAIQLFKYNGLAGGSGNIQIGVAERAPNGSVSLALGAFRFQSEAKSGSLLVGMLGLTSIRFWARGQKMTLDTETYGPARQAVREKLDDAADYVAALCI